MTAATIENRLLKALAAALVQSPRATLQELAKEVGVSKATLYRFSHTREQLIERLMLHCAEVMAQVLQDSQLDSLPVEQALHCLIENHLAEKEFGNFLVYYCGPDTMDGHSPELWQEQEKALEMFFLKGQREGFFRIDITAASLVDVFYFMIGGLTDAERRGRIARASLVMTMEQLFLYGAHAGPKIGQ